MPPPAPTASPDLLSAAPPSDPIRTEPPDSAREANASRSSPPRSLAAPAPSGLAECTPACTRAAVAPTPLKTARADATMLAASAAFAGTTSVLECLAIAPKARIYCSASRIATASAPPAVRSDAAMRSIAAAEASAASSVARASASARLMRSCLLASERKMAEVLSPSAALTVDCRSPSESRMAARFRRSASASSSIAARTAFGGTMSRISYRMH
mmetsp:Transcript_6288/g.19700  ORF Transcript_6288/g.19700 Transcript_6288/m.19700 type:complete len:215 (+) Transcript_6288:485-1129(+)